MVYNDHRNNLGKSEKDSPFYFEYLNDRSWTSCPLKSMVISISLKIGMVKFVKNVHIFLIVQKRILNDNIRHFII